MPRLNASTMENHQLAGNFGFTGARIANLGATEYTLVTILVDVTGSVDGFQDQLREALITAVQACQKSPRSDNLMVRAALFSTQFGREAMSELHGFTPLSELDPQTYPILRPGGGTPLYDAVYSGVAAMNAYGKALADQDYLVNGITFIITDGEESGASTMSPTNVKTEIERSVQGEVLESHVSVLIGINASYSASALQRFQQDAGITQFIDAGSATKGSLAKLAAFVSQSVSSQSQALGTGGPSQAISATI